MEELGGWYKYPEKGYRYEFEFDDEDVCPFCGATKDKLTVLASLCPAEDGGDVETLQCSHCSVIYDERSDGFIKKLN